MDKGTVMHVACNSMWVWYKYHVS